MKVTVRNSSDDESEKYGKIRKQEHVERRRWLSTFFVIIVVSVLGYNARGRMKSVYPANELDMMSLEQEIAAKQKIVQKQKRIDRANNARGGGRNVGKSGPKEIERLEKLVADYDDKVRKINRRVKIFEKDEEGQKAAKLLQDATRRLIQARYGVHDLNKPLRVRVNLEFQPSMPDFAEKGSEGSILIEMAPIALVPHSVFTFLEIVRNFKSGAFHRNAVHVLQATVRGKGYRSLAFQEYSNEYPHVKGTVGYAGRPSGPAWYISIQDNSRNHGPGSQQTQNPYEADSCFGRVIEGFDDIAVGRIHKMPGSGFVNDSKKQVKITSMTIFVPITSPKNTIYKPYSE